MFLSVFDMFKVGIGPSSSHTIGPMLAAALFLDHLRAQPFKVVAVQASLHGSLAFTGVGHATDRAVVLGLGGFRADDYDALKAEAELDRIKADCFVAPEGLPELRFDPRTDLIFDYGPALPGHANGLILRGLDAQGDVVTESRLVYMADTMRPGTPLSEELARRGGQQGLRPITSTGGLVAISQTCDIVAKSSLKAPFVVFAALIELDDATAALAVGGDLTRYACVPAFGQNHFADLDRLQSLEKSALVGVAHKRGVLGTDQEAAFGTIVARRFGRFAYPDDLHDSLRDLQSRFKKRHRKEESSEGKALRQVSEIRILAEPSWSASEISVVLIFILDAGVIAAVTDGNDDEPSVEIRQLLSTSPTVDAVAQRILGNAAPADRRALFQSLASAWAASCKPVGLITSIKAEVVCSDEMTVARYWQSQLADLDYLSQSIG